MLLNETIFNPALELGLLTSEIENKKSLRIELIQTIKTFERIIDQLQKYKLQLPNEFPQEFCDDLLKIKNLINNKTKEKYYKIQLTDLIIHNKKGKSINSKFITNTLLAWNNELNKIKANLIQTNDVIKTLKLKFDRFVVSNGQFETNQTNNNFEEKLPSQNKSCVNIGNIKPNVWYAWPNDLEYLSGEKFKSRDNGIGAGEYWLSYILGGKVQGPNSTFDLSVYNEVKDQYERWEIKEIDKTLTIRLGAHGTNEAIDMSLEINDVMTQLKNFIDTYEALGFSMVSLEGDSLEEWLSRYACSLKIFIDTYYNKLAIKGDISNCDLKELMSPCVGAVNVFNRINDENNNKEAIIDFCNRKLKLSFEQYSKFLLLIPEQLTKNEKLIALISIFKHPVLCGKQTYQEFISTLINMLMPSKAFNNVNGVFLTHKIGFMMIPTQDTDNAFDYCRMSQGRRPNFKIKIKNPEQEKELIKLQFFNYSHLNDDSIIKSQVLISGSLNAIGGCVTMADDVIFPKHQSWLNVSLNDDFKINKKFLKILPIC